MNIDTPKDLQLSQLRALWQEAFGDSEEFLNIFERTAFSPDRCRCVTSDGRVIAALYWFDCSYLGERVAYLYAIATAKSHRGMGVCRALLDDTHRHLKELGYGAAVLVPGSDELFAFYKKSGYDICSYVGEFCCCASEDKLEMRRIEIDEYAKLRRKFLPDNAIIQENESLKFLDAQAELYVGHGFLLAARVESKFIFGIELLGDDAIAPHIVRTLECENGRFRTPEGDKPFAMYYNLRNINPPFYFGLAFD